MPDMQAIKAQIIADLEALAAVQAASDKPEDLADRLESGILIEILLGPSSPAERSVTGTTDCKFPVTYWFLGMNESAISSLLDSMPRFYEVIAAASPFRNLQALGVMKMSFDHMLYPMGAEDGERLIGLAEFRMMVRYQ